MSPGLRSFLCWYLVVPGQAFPVEQNRKGLDCTHSTALLLFTGQPTVMPSAIVATEAVNHFLLADGGPVPPSCRVLILMRPLLSSQAVICWLPAMLGSLYRSRGCRVRPILLPASSEKTNQVASLEKASAGSCRLPGAGLVHLSTETEQRLRPADYSSWVLGGR